MNINYYAPNTSTEFRMWAVDEISREFPDAALVAVFDQVGETGCFLRKLGSPHCGGSIEVEDGTVETFDNVYDFTSSLIARWHNIPW